MDKTFVVESKGERLDNFVLDKLDKTRSAIKKMIELGDITVNGKTVKAGYSLRVGDSVLVVDKPPVATDILPENIKLDIVYQDDDLAVINKPQGMVVHPSSGCYSKTLVNALLYNIHNLSGINGEIRPGIVHRLDKDTSGLIVIAKNDKAHVELSRQIQNKTCARIYRALVKGNFPKESGRITTNISRGTDNRKKMFVVPEGEGRVAITDYKVLQHFNKCTYMEFSLQTGRTHQIRVHCAHMGHPIIGDRLYGQEEGGLNGQLLHAYKIRFIHPTSGKEMEFNAPLPDYFEKYLLQLK